MDTIKQILMERDEMSSEAADELIEEAREALQLHLENGGDIEGADRIAEVFFGLEPDYLYELVS